MIEGAIPEVNINLYEKLSMERKQLQREGRLPKWYLTGGWQLAKAKYLYDAPDLRAQFKRIAKTAARHLINIDVDTVQLAEQKFFDMLWKGHLSPSTPVLSNTGTNRGLPVSCQGQDFGDSIDTFYSNKHELAMHTKFGFGTSGYFGNIRSRGTPIKGGGKAEGVLPVFKGIIQDMQYVSQGSTRRGSFAGYLPIDHGDFDEIVDFIYATPDDANVGWNVRDAFIQRLEAQEPEAVRRFQRSQRLKMTTGRGYYFFEDKVNRLAPEAIKKSGRRILASNLCSEICLPSDDDYIFICVLSSANLLHWDAIRESDDIFWMTVFLDCINSEFIHKAKNLPGMRRSVRFAEDFAALGLGACGLHTLFQSKGIPFESFQAHQLNKEIFEHMNKESRRASEWLYDKLGPVKWTKGTGMRNATRLAVAPTKSTALLMGGVSEGINADPAMTYTQASAGGEMLRVNQFILRMMRERGAYSKKEFDALNDAKGSIQGVSWMDSSEKEVFKTAFEMNMEAVLRMGAARQREIDQGQSLNLHFSADEDPRWIGHIHRLAFLDPNIKATYYVYSQRGIKAAPRECIACQ